MTITPTGPHITFENIFEKPVLQNIFSKKLSKQSTIAYNYGASNADATKDARECIDDILQQTKTELGITQKNPLKLPANVRAAWIERVKAIPAWQKAALHVARIDAPDLAKLDDITLLTAINRPWWNTFSLARDAYSYDNNEVGGIYKLSLSSKSTYSSQARETLKLPIAATGRPISVVGVVITSDGVIPLGLRGGQNFHNTIMALPAGSAEYHSGKNPLFESIAAELLEETGLRPSLLDSLELVGSFRQNVMANFCYYAFRARTSLSYAQLDKLWRSAEDGPEHKLLIPIPNDPEEAIKQFKHMQFDPYIKPEYVYIKNGEKKKRVRKPLSNTYRGNMNTILPQGFATVLAHFAQQEGKIWAERTQSRLENMYVFE